MKYIDSNVFIYPVIADEKTEAKAASCRKILLEIATGNMEAATSFLTWDEFMWILSKYLGKEIAVIQGRKFLEFPNLRFIEVGENVISRANELVNKYAINPRDAIHASCALEIDADGILTDDQDFDKVKELRRIRL
jgi:predicted nucleic acid-binding protein